MNNNEDLGLVSFNTITGIKLSLKSLKRFEEMLDKRRDAHYIDRKKLKEFIVDGRW